MKFFFIAINIYWQKKSQYPNYVCTFMIILSQSLLYRCPPGYLFSTVIVRCAKQEEVSCPLDQPSEADFRYKQFVQRSSLGQITCKYFSGESTPSSWLSTNLTTSLLVGRKNHNSIIAIVLPCLPLMSATFCIIMILTQSCQSVSTYHCHFQSLCFQIVFNVSPSFQNFRYQCSSA